MSRNRGRRGGVRPVQHLKPVERIEPVRRGEVIDLGEMGGDDRPPLTATFNYFGRPVRLDPNLSEVDIIDFLEGAESLNENDARSMLIIKDFVRTTIHEADFDTFWTLVREHRQTSQEVLDLMFQLIQGVTGNPTGSPSGSSAGRPVTTVSLPPDVSPPDSPSEGSDPRRAAYLRQIARFQDPHSPDAHPTAGTENGVAIAAQIANAAKAAGVELHPELALSANASG